MKASSDLSLSALGYSSAQAAVDDLVSSHALPMAILSRDLRVLGVSDVFASCLPAGRHTVSGLSIEDLLELLSQEPRRPPNAPEGSSPSGSRKRAAPTVQEIHAGEWRLRPLVTHDGRVVVPFSYPLKSGNIQLVLMEPERLNEVTDLGEVLDVAADAFAIFDENQSLIRCNTQFVALLTYDPTSPPPLGWTAREIVQKVVEAGTLLVGAGLDERSMVDAMVAGLLTPNGATFEVEGKLGRIFLAATKPRSSGGHILTLRDITDIRRAERQAVSTMRAAVDSLEQGFAYYDEALTLQVWNEQYDRMYCGDCGLHPQQGEDGVSFLRRVMDAGRFKLEPGKTIEECVENILQKIARGERTEYHFSDGTSALCSYNRTSSNGLLVTLLDITDKLDSEYRALNTLREAANALEEGFSLWDQDLNFILCNDRYCELVFKDPAFRPVPGQARIDVSLIAAENALNDLPSWMTREDFARQSFERIKRLEKHIEMKLDNGRIVEFSGHRTAQGGYLITVLDITERHRAAQEIERQAQIAHQNEKLSALGELLAGVAHELNNPLSIVVGYSQLLAGELTDLKQIDRIGKITRAAERSARIVKTFLAMARQKPAKMEIVDLADVIETAVDVAAYGLRAAGGRLRVNCAPDLPLVEADKDQMVQVFSNLIVNAEHAMRGMGSDARLSIRATGRAGLVDVVICDNGTGMDAETQARIFEPFFTTKDVGAGTGFGLAFCHRIVTSHGGELSVVSLKGKGSQFTIALPAINEVPPDEAIAAVTAGKGLKALVVDDEEDVADLIAEILTARGHSVECAYGPAQALEAVQLTDFDFVLSDMKMPDMTGDQLLREIILRRPRLQGHVGFITGDSLSAKVRDFLEDGEQHFIEKPVVVGELIELIERIRPRHGKSRA